MKTDKDSQGYQIQLPMGEKHLEKDCTMLTLGFDDYALQHFFVIAPVKWTCILGSDFLECWEADIIFETR